MNKNYMSLLGNYLVFLGIALTVTVVWQIVELYILGEVIPSDVDTVIALILTTSLYFNWKHVVEKEGK